MEEEDDEDIVMNISNRIAKKKQRKHKRAAQQPSKDQENPEGEQAKKRVKFDLNQSMTREFFTYGKVATQKLPTSCPLNTH